MNVDRMISLVLIQILLLSYLAIAGALLMAESFLNRNFLVSISLAHVILLGVVSVGIFKGRKWALVMAAVVLLPGAILLFARAGEGVLMAIKEGEAFVKMALIFVVSFLLYSSPLPFLLRAYCVPTLNRDVLKRPRPIHKRIARSSDVP